MSCPSSTHDFKTWGDHLFCRKCGDVLWPAQRAVVAPQSPPSLPFLPAAAAAPEPTPEELEAAIVRLREAAGLGTRHEAPEDLLEQFEADRPRARVPAEFDDTLPDSGL